MTPQSRKSRQVKHAKKRRKNASKQALHHACLGTCVFCVTSLLALEGAADRSPPCGRSRVRRGRVPGPTSSQVKILFDVAYKLPVIGCLLFM